MTRLNSTDRWELNGENLTLNGTRVAMIKSGGDIPYKMSSAGDLSEWAGPGVGRLASGFNLAAAAYIFLIYAPK